MSRRSSRSARRFESPCSPSLRPTRRLILLPCSYQVAYQLSRPAASVRDVQVAGAARTPGPWSRGSSHSYPPSCRRVGDFFAGGPARWPPLLAYRAASTSLRCALRRSVQRGAVEPPVEPRASERLNHAENLPARSPAARRRTAATAPSGSPPRAPRAMHRAPRSRMRVYLPSLTCGIRPARHSE